jgi:hypothetical protein
VEWFRQRSHHFNVGRVAENFTTGELILYLVHQLGPSDVEPLDPGPLPEHLLVLVIEADTAPGAEMMNSRRSLKLERMESR